MKPTQNLIWIVALVTLCTFWSSREVHVQTIEPLQNPFAGNEDAITEGAIFFRSFCWGVTAEKYEAEKAPDLLKPQWLHGWSETGIFETIFNGRPGRGWQNIVGN